MEDKQEKKLPYRFICSIPCEVMGHREITEEDLRELREFKERERIKEEKARKEKESK